MPSVSHCKGPRRPRNMPQHNVLRRNKVATADRSSEPRLCLRSAAEMYTAGHQSRGSASEALGSLASTHSVRATGGCVRGRGCCGNTSNPREKDTSQNEVVAVNEDATSERPSRRAKVSRREPSEGGAECVCDGSLAPLDFNSDAGSCDHADDAVGSTLKLITLNVGGLEDYNLSSAERMRRMLDRVLLRSPDVILLQ